MLRKTTVLAALALTVALVAAGCGDDKGEETTKTSKAPASTFPGEVGSLPEPTAVKGGPQSAEDAARELYEAWKAGDASRANKVADEDVVTALFAKSGKDFTWTFGECEATDVQRTYTCTWTGKGAPTMTVANTRGYGWYVIDLTPIG